MVWEKRELLNLNKGQLKEKQACPIRPPQKKVAFPELRRMPTDFQKQLLIPDIT